MARFRGQSTLKTVYNVDYYYPLDTRMLVPTYADLTLESNWLYKNGSGESNAYNGMIVAVGSNTSDYTKNGIYYLFDKKNPGEDDVPDVTNPDNWHKVAEMSDLEAFIRETDLFKKIETEDELPKDFAADSFNPNITYYRVRVLDAEADSYIVYTYMYDKDLNRYLRKVNNSSGVSVSNVDIGEDGSITLYYSDGTTKELKLGASNVDLTNYATKDYVEEYVEEYVEDSFTDFTESLKTTILYGGDSDPGDD